MSSRHRLPSYAVIPQGGGPAWIRPATLEVVSGTVTGGDVLATAPYPYDPDPLLRASLASGGVRIGGVGAPATARLTFPVAVASQASGPSIDSFLAQLLLVHSGALTIDMPSAAGYPHDYGLTGILFTTFGQRLTYGATPDRVDITSEGALVRCALGLIGFTL
ncbi:MAG: hypothetical protein H0U69_03385 [Trueperaceae bacterium]|nr:hypothetical protein [Trueperaceae bacterium]